MDKTDTTGARRICEHGLIETLPGVYILTLAECPKARRPNTDMKAMKVNKVTRAKEKRVQPTLHGIASSSRQVD